MTHADWCDQDLNPNLRSFAHHYGVALLSCRPRTPEHNGAIEHGIGEVKSTLTPALGRPPAWDPAAAVPPAPAVVQHLNYAPRRRLAGRSAAQGYLQRPGLRWNRPQRHTFFAWIGAHSKRILRAVDHPGLHDVRRAWCHAVEAWLRRQGLIEISINGETVTPFFPEISTVLLHRRAAGRGIRCAPESGAVVPIQSGGETETAALVSQERF